LRTREVKSNGSNALKRLVIGNPDNDTNSVPGSLDSAKAKNQQNVEVIRLNYSDDPDSSYENEFSTTTVNDLDSVLLYAKNANVHEVCIEPSAILCDMLVNFAQQLADIGMPLKVVPEQYEVLVQAKVSNQDICLPVIELLDKEISRMYLVIKRLMDVGIVVIGFLLLVILYPFIAVCTKLNSRGPVFYKQERVGLHGKTFIIWKFRTMRTDAEKHSGPVWAKKEDERITYFGKILRRTRFDELPQLINILKGEMSFIGPRPERPHFVRLLNERIPGYLQRLQVKPGITGWAQIHANYDRDIDDVRRKLQYDLYYIDNMSLLIDLMIIVVTFKVALNGKGAH
jgi:exopolysaccharide biosynthesis polyprenyl glycosylphosphotransferase